MAWMPGPMKVLMATMICSKMDMLCSFCTGSGAGRVTGLQYVLARGQDETLLENRGSTPILLDIMTQKPLAHLAYLG